MRALKWLLLLCGLAWIGSFAPGVQAQFGNLCDDEDSSYYRAVYPIYEYRNRRLVLKDAVTRADVQEIEINLEAPRLNARWVPTCRYLFAAVNGSYVVWDTTTNTRVLEFPAQDGDGILFSPDGNYFIQSVHRDGLYLWNIASGQSIKISDNVCQFHDHWWDLERGHFLGVPGSRINPAHCSYDIKGREVEVYDIHTGQLITEYPNRSTNYGIEFDVLEDRQHIVLETQRDGSYPEMSIRNVETHLGARVFVYWPYDEYAISSDYRYWAAVGATRLYMWNIENFDAELIGREPLYHLDVPYESTIRFVDNQTLEITSDRGVQMIDVASGTAR